MCPIIATKVQGSSCDDFRISIFSYLINVRYFYVNIEIRNTYNSFMQCIYGAGGNYIY